VIFESLEIGDCGLVIVAAIEVDGAFNHESTIDNQQRIKNQRSANQ
jgi:hypothetical protein